MIRTLAAALLLAGLVWTSTALALTAEAPDDRLTPGEIASTDQADVCGYVGDLASELTRTSSCDAKAPCRAFEERAGLSFVVNYCRALANGCM